MKVVDTTVLVDHARADQAVAAFLADHADETLVVSTLSFQEIAVGEVLTRNESLTAILDHLGTFDIQDHTAANAYHAAVIEATLRKDGMYDPVLARDLLNGGVARSLSVPIVTRNADHFSRFGGVSVETY